MKNSERGITLVELMFAMVIAAFIIGAIYSTYVVQHKSYTVQDQVVEMQECLRAGANMLTCDVRMAGFMVPGAAIRADNNNVGRTIVAEGPGGSSVTYNILDHTDMILVSRVDPNSIPALITKYSRGVGGGASSLEADNQGDITEGDEGRLALLYCANGQYQLVWIHNIQEIGGGTGIKINFPPGQASDVNYPGGLDGDYDDPDNPCHVSRAISRRYFIDGTDSAHPRLMLDDGIDEDENGLTDTGHVQPIAENIEDLQFAYQLADGSWTDSPGAGAGIRQVRINALARTDRTDPEWNNPWGGMWIEDRNHLATADGHRRRLLQSTVLIRNLFLWEQPI